MLGRKSLKKIIHPNHSSLITAFSENIDSKFCTMYIYSIKNSLRCVKLSCNIITDVVTRSVRTFRWWERDSFVYLLVSTLLLSFPSKTRQSPSYSFFLFVKLMATCTHVRMYDHETQFLRINEILIELAYLCTLHTRNKINWMHALFHESRKNFRLYSISRTWYSQWYTLRSRFLVLKMGHRQEANTIYVFHVFNGDTCITHREKLFYIELYLFISIIKYFICSQINNYSIIIYIIFFLQYQQVMYDKDLFKIVMLTQLYWY